MTKWKVNVHEPRIIEQKWSTLTVNVKEIETSEQALEIKEKLEAIMDGIIRDSQGQRQLEAAKTKEKVVEKARKRTKKLDQAVGA